MVYAWTCKCYISIYLDIDDCFSDPCLNGAVCLDGANRYGCICNAGYTGQDCQTGNASNLIS